MNKRGLLLLFILLISSFAFGFEDYADKYSCHEAGGLWCDNFENYKCADLEDLTNSANAIDCQISSNYYIDVADGLGNNILYFNKLSFDEGASIHFVDDDASESTMPENDYEYECSGNICTGKGGSGGSRDSDGGNGGAGGDGAIAGSKGETGEAGDQPGDSPGDEECNSGNADGGSGGIAGGDITIIATEIELQDNTVISVNGRSGVTGNNCLNTGGNNAGSGGGGGGGGGGAGTLVLLITELSGSGELKLHAKGGSGGSGKAGKDDDGTFGGDDDGGGGGGGAGGEGGQVYFSVETSETTYSLSASGGSSGSGGSGPDDADDGGAGEDGPDGETFGPGEWDISELGITEIDFGSQFVVCNDGIDNDADGNTDMADEDCYETAAEDSGWKTEAHNLAADWFDASSNTGADGVCGDDAGNANCIGNLYCPSIPNDDCGNFEGCSITGGATSCDSLWNDETACSNQEGCSWEWQDSYCSGFLWSDSVCSVFGSDLCGLPGCWWISGHNDCVGTATSCEDNVNQIGCECTGSPSCDSFDTCYDEYGCNYMNEGDDFGYVDPEGTYFCNYRDIDDDGSPEWTWENSQSSPLGTTFALGTNSEVGGHEEHIITNSQKWFVCDANSSTSLTYFSETDYDSMIEEFGNIAEPSDALYLGQMSCLDALTTLTEFENFIYCEDGDFENAAYYQNCCRLPENGGVFYVDDPEGFETKCGSNCYGSTPGNNLLNTYPGDLCDISPFNSLAYCTGNSLTMEETILLDLCGFDLQGCLVDFLNPFDSCEDQGFTHSKVCTEENAICSGSLIYSNEIDGPGYPEQVCCVSNSEEVSCSDSSSIIDEDSCLNNGGTVYMENEGSCSPPSFSISLSGGQSCCLGVYLPPLDMDTSEPTDKFICYKGNLDTTTNNMIAECCFDDHCINYYSSSYGTDSNFRGPGSGLHEITIFDRYEHGTGQFKNYGKILRTESANEDLSVIGGDELRTTNWEGFNILEFDVGFNNADYFEIYIEDSNGLHDLGKLKDHLVTGSQPFRWQRAMIILPQSIDSEDIDYSNIQRIKITSEHSEEPYPAQIIIDDFSLSRMEVLE